APHRLPVAAHRDRPPRSALRRHAEGAGNACADGPDRGRGRADLNCGRRTRPGARVMQIQAIPFQQAAARPAVVVVNEVSADALATVVEPLAALFADIVNAGVSLGFVP